MKKLFAIAILASFTAFAAPLKWTCDWPEAKSQTFSLYQGETATFEPTFRVNGQLVTNATIEAVWYQTNGMDNAWWRLDNATFAPSNDVGAATYRFFVEATALGGTVYRANGSLRMLPSPGFVPNAISPPVVALDFAQIEVSNAPYYTQDETDAKIVELAPAPGNYETVSNKAMTALQSYDETDPTVPDWAKTSSKPSYTAEEVGATLKVHFSPWVISPATDTWGDPYSMALSSDNPITGYWQLLKNGSVVAFSTSAKPYSTTASFVTMQGHSVSASRSVQGYQFGNDTDHILAAQKDMPGDYSTISNFAMMAYATITNPPWIAANGQTLVSTPIFYTGMTQFKFEDDCFSIAPDGESPMIIMLVDGDGGYFNLLSNDPEYHWIFINGSPVITSNQLASATSGLLRTETDPNVPAWAKAASKPSYSWSEIASKPSFATVATSGSYNDLSNKPTIPDISGKADESALAAVAQAATNYTDEAIAAIPAPDMSDYAPVSTVASNSADIANLKVESSLVYRLYSGSNVVCEVTNYNSAVRSPTMRLLQLDTNGVYTVVWTETNNLHRVAQAATNYTDAAIAAHDLASESKYAPRAWSGVTSGLGAEAPPGVTWISTPQTVLAGGFEYVKVVTTSGEAWILTGNGMTAATNRMGYLDISASDGTSVFRIEKTDSYLVGAAADSITRSGDTVTVTLPVVSQEHPLLRYAATLDSPVTWYNEEDSNLPASVTYSWGGSSGAWVCTITTTAPSGFFRFEFLQQGSTKIVNAGMTDLSGGIWFNGTKYVPTVNGNKLEFVAE